LFERKYKKWNGSFSSLKEIQDTDYQRNWEIAKVLKINESDLVLKLISDESEILIENRLNYFGTKKEKPTNFLNINDYVFVSNIQNNYILCQPLEINGAVVVMDPYNGNILSMVGGVNYKESKFNRSYQASRQPGSSIKPFIYAQALENRSYLPNSMILDSNILLEQGPNLPIWIPKNYSNKSYGKMTFRRALESSNNLVTLKIGLDLGLNSVNDFFNKIKLYKSEIDYDVYSLLLGAIENNLLDITKSYSIFLNGGYLVEPNIIKKVVSDKGQLISEQKYFTCKYCDFTKEDRSYRKPKINKNQIEVISPQTSFQLLNILEGAVKRGTGKSLNSINYPLAGKTGTTNDSKDLWFFGLTPKFVVGVYVGYDSPKKIGYRETGSSVALPVFKSLINDYLNDYEISNEDEFFIPNNLILKKIDPDTGDFFSDNNAIIEYFTKDQLETLNNLNKVSDIGGIN
jgi:penicillin-binding protein 1A